LFLSLEAKEISIKAKKLGGIMTADLLKTVPKKKPDWTPVDLARAAMEAKP